jgi:NitT/TauT family transport system substrate-binding protein
MVLRFLVSFLVGASLVMSYLGADYAQSGEKTKMRFGTLPVLQSLPLYVARDKGFFGKAGVDVELIPFNTAAEKDIALTTKNIDGYFGDLFTPIVMKSNGRDVRIVATNYDTSHDRRMFAVLGKPGSAYGSVKDLAGVPVAVSSNSVIDFVTFKLLTAAGVSPSEVQTIESKNIGLRMQMLLSGQVEAATLPEPLVTAAAAKGAPVLADDAGIPESQTILLFTGTFIEKHPEAVKAFLNAVSEASRLTNSQPDAVRPIMVKHVRLPKPLKDKYPVPRFPDLHAPKADTVRTAVGWLKDRGVLNKRVTYKELVDDRFIP